MNKAQGQPQDSPVEKYAGASSPNSIGYRFIELDPGSNIYIQRDDILMIRWMTNRTGGDTLNVGVRMLMAGRQSGPTQPDHATAENKLGISPLGVVFPIFQQFTTTALNTEQTSTITLAEGYLLSLAISCTGASTRGVTFAKAFIVRASSNLLGTTYALASDYATFDQAIGWPGGRVISSLEGPGQLATITVANPAAGADWTLSLPNSTRVRIASIQGTFQASGAVGNRNIRFQIVDVASGLNFGTYAVNAVVTSGQLATVNAASGVNPSALIALNVSCSLPENLFIRNDGFTELRLRTSTQNIDASDQWSNVSVGVERWLEM